MKTKERRRKTHMLEENKVQDGFQLQIHTDALPAEDGFMPENEQDTSEPDLFLIKDEKEPTEREKQREIKSELRRKRARALLLNKKRIALPIDSESLVGQDVQTAVNLFTRSAFTDVKTVAIKDIDADSPFLPGQIKQTVIAGTAAFDIGEFIPYDAPIVITYHAKKEIIMPYAEKELCKFDRITVSQMIKELGFFDIYEHPIRDLRAGFFKKDGSVEKVLIDGVAGFKKNSVFPFDADVVIEYHTFKKK